MRRILGAIAIFLGWLCLPLSVASGLVASRFLGLTSPEGDLTPSAVFGISGEVFLWMVIGVALVATVPALAAMFAEDPSRPLYAAGGVAVAVALLLSADQLGRAYASFLLPGGILLATGGWLMAGAAKEAAGPATELGEGAPSPVEELPATASAAPAREPAATLPALPEEAACPWCSAVIPFDATICPECHATVDRGLVAERAEIPGVTQVPAELRAYSARAKSKSKRRSLLARAFSDGAAGAAPAVEPVSRDAFRAPSPEVRAEMARIDREIAGLATGDEPRLSPPEPGAPLPELEAVDVAAAETPTPPDGEPAATEPPAPTEPRPPNVASASPLSRLPGPPTAFARIGFDNVRPQMPEDR